jgi:hypothetical protein
MNASVSPAPDALAIELADHVLEHDPVEDEPWEPGIEVPHEYVPLLGVWFSEGHPFVFSVARGRLEARIDLPAAAKLPPSVFERVSDDVYRTASGRERGELLRVTRAADGSVTKLNWATYLFTREPMAFGEHFTR